MPHTILSNSQLFMVCEMKHWADRRILHYMQ